MHMAEYQSLDQTFSGVWKSINNDRGSSAPKHSEILQKEHENQLVYVCLIEKFYPEVIRVKWTDEGRKEITQNVVKGDVWKAADDDTYSVSTWLTVPLESKNKYFCNYEHESGEDSLSTQVSSEMKPPQELDCSTNSGNGTIFNRDQLTHKAAQLVYTVLLLKSSMYYVIVLFFMYRMRAPAQLSGKNT